MIDVCWDFDVAGTRVKLVQWQKMHITDREPPMTHGHSSGVHWMIQEPNAWCDVVAVSKVCGGERTMMLGSSG